MSLHALANHMASKGRSGDSMLVHMTPGEVKALQALAERHGGTLTINPETGQPEANFLKKLLPAIAGAALNFFAPGVGTAIGSALGTSAAVGTGIAVGGITTLATGSLSRGLMAGLGAYGGAGLAEGLAGAGAGAAQDAALAGLSQEQVAQQAAAQGLTEQGIRNQVAADALKDFAAKSATERASEGIAAAAANPMQFAKTALKPALNIAAPIMADAMVPTTTGMPTTPQGPSYIRQKKFNPYTQQYIDLEPVDASKWGSRQFSDYADGGIVALANGGVSDETVDAFFRGNPAATDAYIAAQMQRFNVSPEQVARVTGVSQPEVQQRYEAAAPSVQSAQNTISNIYQNVLGRDVDPSGLAYWTERLTQGGASGQDMYNEFLSGARANNELVRSGISLEDAVKPYTGYTSAESRNIADEWVRNALGREVTAADRQTDWYKQAQDAATMNTYGAAQNIFSQFEDYARKTGGKNFTDLDLIAASQLLAPIKKPLVPPITYMGGNMNMPGGAADGWTATTPATYAPPGTTNPYGNGVTPGDLTFNADGSVTVQPNIPGRPYGGFTGMRQVKNAYTAGGGSLGQDNLFVPKTVDEMYERFGTTGGSKQAYDYLMGKGAADIKKPAVSGQLMRPYAESVLGQEMAAVTGKPTQRYIFDPRTRRYILNPAYVDPNAKKEETKADTTTAQDAALAAASGGVMRMALGGLGALAGGGSTYNLGSYSDGGRLLRGPGDGVSDSIPATIGDKQPARLADGEFVVPARIVSELGNGSTEAGARKLYAMMDRVQKARGKTTGKGKVAANTRADKYLPA